MNSETPQVDELVHRITNNPGVTWSRSEICEMIELAMRLELRNKRLVEALEGLLEPDYLYAIGSDEDSERSLVYCRMKAARAALTPPTTI